MTGLVFVKTGSINSGTGMFLHALIDLVYAKTSPKCSISLTDNEHFGLIFAKTWLINSGMRVG